MTWPGPAFNLWVEDWAVPLLASDLLPGFVMAHDGSKESNDVLNSILANVEHSDSPPAVIVASTAPDFGVVAKVSSAGGTFYPVKEAPEGLLKTVGRVVSLPAVEYLAADRRGLIRSATVPLPGLSAGVDAEQ
jgi:hypothetical protein